MLDCLHVQCSIKHKDPVHTNLDISETEHFLYRKVAFPQHLTSESAHSVRGLNSCKKICGFKKYLDSCGLEP